MMGSNEGQGSLAAMRVLVPVLTVLLSMALPWGAASAEAMAAPQPAASKSDGFDDARAIIGDMQRIVTPNGIDETVVLTLGGTRQVVNIRGSDKANPILIYIHGGPGSVEMPMAWSFQRPWEDFFTVVQWDQRGAGRS